MHSNPKSDPSSDARNGRFKGSAGQGSAGLAQIEKRQRFWKKARRRLFWTLAVLFVVHSALSISASLSLGHELAAIRQNGDPLQFSEVEPPAVPAAQNAAIVYARATKSLHFSPEEKRALATRARNRTPQIETLIQSALSHNQQALELTRQAASMPQCRFPLDWKGNPTRFLFPYYEEMRELARLLTLHAQVASKNGDSAAALRDVRALFGMSHHLSKEPFLIGFLVAQSVDVLAHRALGQTLQNAPLTVTQARALDASLSRTDWVKTFRSSLVGERVMGIFVFESLYKAVPNAETPDTATESGNDGSSAPPAWMTYPFIWIARPMFKWDEVETLRLWRGLLDSPQSQQVPRPPAWSQAQNDAIRNAPFYASLTKILFPVFTRASDSRDFAEVRGRQREVALALTCFRTARGHYPANLSEAAKIWEKPLPLDPYSQKPFVYRRQGKTFSLYSVGVNRLDDGGVGAQSVGRPANSGADDLMWLPS